MTRPSLAGPGARRCLSRFQRQPIRLMLHSSPFFKFDPCLCNASPEWKRFRRRHGPPVKFLVLVRRVGLSIQQIQKYESDKDRIGASRLEEIARALGVTAAYFSEGLPKNKTEASPAYLPMS